MDPYPELNLYQQRAISKMKNGSVLCGGVGSGKSRTALAYYYTKVCHGGIPEDQFDWFNRMETPKDLYIITTARKRDTHEWEDECGLFAISTEPVTVTIDSWNNITKYVDVKGAFFIFDEQRVVGYGTWAKSFLKIAKQNEWILLSATPGDTWMDYIPVFIANGFYKNKTDFISKHVVFSRYTKYPKVDHYEREDILRWHRDQILVTMEDLRKTVPHHIYPIVEYDLVNYERVEKDRWNVFTGRPCRDAGEMCFVLRRIVNDNDARVEETMRILDEHPKAIVFYTFNYELELLLARLEGTDYKVAQWNGRKHEPLPYWSKKWCYLVEYTAGCEGWNCIETDTIIFYSPSYSYKQMVQAAGRIDRMNSPFIDLYYYHILTKSSIDMAISRCLSFKKKFVESAFCKGLFDGDIYKDKDQMKIPEFDEKNP